MQFRKYMRVIVLVAIIALQASFIANAFAAESKESSVAQAQAIPTLPPVADKISGVVISEGDGLAIKGASVIVYRQFGATWKKAASAKTNGKGQYTFKKLKPGNYRIQVKAAGHQPEFFDNVATLAAATNITLPSGGSANTIVAALTPK